MAVPKKRTSKKRRDMRRSHLALDKTDYVKCNNCGNPALIHRICPSCGFYKGAQVATEQE